MDPVTAAVISWAVNQVGSAGAHAVGRVLGDKQQRALHTVVQRATNSAVEHVIAADDRAVVREGLLVEAPASPDITAEGVLDLRRAVLRQVRPRLTALVEQGYKIDTDSLADEIARRITTGISADAARGGALAPLAKLLRDERLVAATETTARASEEIVAQLQAICSSNAWIGPHADTAGGGAKPAPTRPKMLSRGINLPGRNPHFAGRTEIMARLDGMLGQGSAAVVAMYGLGGIGKTELVLQYAWIHRDRYAIIWWIHASKQVELTADLVRLSCALGLDAGASQERAIDSVRAELAARSDWLLVFDNVDDPSAIRDFLPGGGGHVLITSRVRNWTGVAHVCPVEELSLREAVDYFRISTGHDSPKTAELAKELGCLPLAMAQAAGYFTNKNCSVERYLDLYRAATQRILSEGPRPHGYQETVATTWLLQFESLSAPAIDLLRLVSFLAPDAIPLGMLFGTASLESLPATLRDAVSDPITREATIGEVVSTLLLIRLDDHTFRVHRLVQEITRARLSKRDCAIWTQHATDFILAAFPSQPQMEENWSRMSVLAPHAQVVAMRVEPHQKATHSAVRLLHGLGLYLVEKEQWEMAHEMLEHALSLALFADTSRFTEAAILLSIASIHLGRHDFKAAIKASRQSLNIMEKIVEVTHPELITALLQVALSYHGAGDNQQAYRYFDRVAEILSCAADLPANVVFTALMGLGTGMYGMGEYDAAQHNFEQALTLANALYGERSQSAAHVRNYLAQLYHSRGDHAAADAQLSLATELSSEKFGAGHPFPRRLANRRAEWREDRQPGRQ
jgi:tetratricopeptide (TPR) repeat protein